MRRQKTYKKEALINPQDSYDLSIKELPPIPDWIQEGIKNIGGIHSLTGNPILRGRSAMDFNVEDDMAIFAAEEWRRKYVGAKDTIQEVIGFKLISKEDQTQEFFLTTTDAKRIILDKNSMPTKEAKSKYVILPQLKFRTVEYGIPRYVLERYASAEEFGGDKDWEENRWLDITDPINPKQGERRFDLLGEYPRRGRYVFLSYIEHGVEEQGHVVRTEARLLDQSVLNEISELIADLRAQAEKSTAQRIMEAENALNERREKKKEDFKNELKEILSHRSLFENQPTITVPELPDYSQDNVARLADKAKSLAKERVSRLQEKTNAD